MDTHSPSASTRGLRTSILALATAALLLGALGSTALAAQPEIPGNNGTVKIHEGAGEPASEMRNEPHVCTFHLHFFNGDAGDAGTWEIREWAPGDKGALALSGTYTTDASGEDRDPSAGVHELPDGHYKLFWDGDLDTGKHDKHKVFWVECEDEGGEGPIAPTPPGGNGGGGGEETPTPPTGGVAPTQGTAPTPPRGGGAPTQGTPPVGAVAGATATPAVTLPPTDTASEPSAGSGGLWAAIMVLVVIALATTVSLAMVPASVRQRDGRRR